MIDRANKVDAVHARIVDILGKEGKYQVIIAKRKESSPPFVIALRSTKL